MNRIKKIALYITLLLIIACIIWTMMYNVNEELKQEAKEVQAITLIESSIYRG